MGIDIVCLPLESQLFKGSQMELGSLTQKVIQTCSQTKYGQVMCPSGQWECSRVGRVVLH